MGIKRNIYAVLIMTLTIFFGFWNDAFSLAHPVEIPMDEIYFPDQKPYIDHNNRVMIPVRTVSEYLGGKVDWNAEKKEVDISFHDHKIRLQIGSSNALKYSGLHKDVMDMGTIAVLTEGRVFVPLRFISETMGYEVSWDNQEKVVLLNNQWIIDLSNPGVSIPMNKPQDNQLITGFFPPKGIFIMNETLTTQVILHNPILKAKEVWVRLGFIGPTNKKYELPIEKVTLDPTKNIHHNIHWKVPEGIVSGSYDVYFEVWDRHPNQAGAVPLGKRESLEGFKLYRYQDNFDNFDTDKWKKTNHQLERADLQSKNISLLDGKLRIHMPADRFEGGEFQSSQPLGFGAYEIRMKLPDVPSSLTGFFLYKSPSLHHEIDIEIYNDKTGEFFLTTYADGEKKNLHLDKMSFDPTLDFHNYRIEYYPDRVSFYIDDVFMKAWSNGFTNEPMFLVVNSWYPDWLEGIPSTQDNTYLEIDWIRY